MWVIKFDKTSQSEAVLTRALISHILSHYVVSVVGHTPNPHRAHLLKDLNSIGE